MNLILLIEDEALRSNIEKTISDQTRIGVLTSSSCEDAFGLIELMGDVAAIIFDDGCRERLLSKVKETSKVIDLLYVGSQKITEPSLNLHSFTEVDKIPYYLVQNTSSAEIEVDVIDDKELYYPIKSSVVVKIQIAPVDVYVRLKKEGYFHYIKYLHSDDTLEEKQLKKLDKLPQIFIKRSDKEEYFKKINHHLEKLLQTSDGTSEKATEIEIDVKQEVFNQLLSVGLSEDSVKVAEATINNVVKSLAKGLQNEINKFSKSDTPVHFRKSYLTSILCISISEHLDWVSEENKNSLVLCAFFNDRYLVKEEMHMITTLYQLESTSLTQEEKKLFMHHAQITASWVKEQGTIPYEVERLICQHHGSKDGVGIESSLSAQITMLSMVFIVAENFAMEIIKNSQGKLDVKSALEELNKMYENSKITKIIQALFKGLKATA